MLSTVSLAAAVSDLPSAPSAVSFSVRAAAEPGVMPRILELFAKRGLVPRRWNSAVLEAGLGIELEISGLEREAIDYLARCIRQIHGVETVFTVENCNTA
jgi:acetolactate synthase small subunit